MSVDFFRILICATPEIIRFRYTDLCLLTFQAEHSSRQYPVAVSMYEWISTLT